MKIRLPDTIRARLMFPSLIVALVMGIGMYHFVKSAIGNVVNEKIIPSQINQLVDYQTSKINHVFEKAITFGRFIAADPSIVSFLSEEYKKKEQGVDDKLFPESLKNYFKHFKDYFGLNTIYVASTSTYNYYTDSGFLNRVDLNLTENNWFESTLASANGYEINIDSAMTGKLSLWLDAVVSDENRVLGLAGFGLDISDIVDRIREIDFGAGTKVRIIDAKMMVKMASSTNNYLNIPFSDDANLEERTLQKITEMIKVDAFNQGEFKSRSFIDDGDRYFIVAPLQALNWHIVVDFPKRNIFENYEVIITIVMLFSIAWGIFIWIAGYFLINTQVISPLGFLAKTLREYKPDKRFDVSAFKNMPREFQEIGESFEYTSMLLETSYNDLKIFNENLEGIVDEQTKLLHERIGELNFKNVELESTKKEALKAAEAKSLFISGVSHELRTPLNAIINFTDMILEDFDDMLKDNELQEDTKEYLGRVLNNSKHLLKLINDILDFSKLEAGKIEYDRDIFEINEFLTTLYRSTESLNERKDRVAYTLELAQKNVLIECDKRRFMQLCLNLVSNAIKFTESGYVKIKADVDGNSLTLKFEDSGRGIEEEKLEEVFVPFSQVNKHDKGTGLGLGIVKRYAEDMGMSLDVESEVGRGSIFIITTKIKHEKG